MSNNHQIYIANAFTKGSFTGNPAAYIPLKNWPNDDVLQALAEQNNLSETVFTVPHIKEDYEIRWFTPTTEVRLCGHATLVCAFIQFELLQHNQPVITFASKSGQLIVSKSEKLLQLDFPSDEVSVNSVQVDYMSIFGTQPTEAYEGKDDLLLIYDDPEVVRAMIPDYGLMKTIKTRGVIISAPDDGPYDFISRGFFPQCGINEDPATGSAHTALTPYWSRRLQKTILTGHQCSKRGGYFKCQYLGERTLISGRCDLYLTGSITF